VISIASNAHALVHREDARLFHSKQDDLVLMYSLLAMYNSL